MSSCFAAMMMMMMIMIQSLMIPLDSTFKSTSYSYDWDYIPLMTLPLIFPYSSVPSSPSRLKSNDNDEKWRIEYQRTIKKIRTKHPELQYEYYIDLHDISRPYGYIPASMLPSTRGQHSYDCLCHTCYDWTKIPASCPTQAPPRDLQHYITLMRLHGIIGLKHMKITHLLLLQSLPH